MNKIKFGDKIKKMSYKVSFGEDVIQLRYAEDGLSCTLNVVFKLSDNQTQRI